ncbi:MFS transporter [uncultured Microbacterium sp.]|jgi:MFS family permease|uniref:MFS transporter n=1 Tax=uncultured Microbacterium sp. TaxID=191216 RepID=UPI0025FA69B6|nr:MFS transporter [uncultured Microbacterium sp.]
MPRSALTRLLAFGPMIYGPTVLFALGEGAVLPLIPVIASALGGDIATAAIVSSAVVVGQLCGNLPAGWAVARVGERWAMVAASVLGMLGVGAVLLAQSLAVLTVGVFIVGFCAAVFGLARHAFMTTRVPIALRARALSLLGGTFRLGMFVGPFITAALLAVFGTEYASAWFFLVCLAGAGALVLFGPDPERSLTEPHDSPDSVAPATGAGASEPADSGEPITTGPVPVAGHRVGIFRTMWQNRTVLSRLGLAAASLSALRSARQVALPLWGVSIGLDAQTIALVVGLSGAIDFALFYASGQVMDRFGRLWAALPAMLLMSGAFLALSVTHDGTQPALWYAMFAAMLGVGNGLSSGILLTLGADVAPRTDPAPFLGSWRTLTDAGGAAAPVVLSAVAALASLPIAVAVMGALGLVGAAAFARWVPRFVPRTRTR